VVLTSRDQPANDSGGGRVALNALIDDLAALAVELYFSGRLAIEDSPRSKISGQKLRRDDI
jgi:hypothetical protein